MESCFDDEGLLNLDFGLSASSFPPSSNICTPSPLMAPFSWSPAEEAVVAPTKKTSSSSSRKRRREGDGTTSTSGNRKTCNPAEFRKSMLCLMKVVSTGQFEQVLRQVCGEDQQTLLGSQPPPLSLSSTSFMLPSSSHPALSCSTSPEFPELLPSFASSSSSSLQSCTSSLSSQMISAQLPVASAATTGQLTCPSQVAMQQEALVATLIQQQREQQKQQQHQHPLLTITHDSPPPPPPPPPPTTTVTTTTSSSSAAPPSSPAAPSPAAKKSSKSSSAAVKEETTAPPRKQHVAKVVAPAEEETNVEPPVKTAPTDQPATEEPQQPSFLFASPRQGKHGPANNVVVGPSNDNNNDDKEDDDEGAQGNENETTTAKTEEEDKQLQKDKEEDKENENEKEKEKGPKTGQETEKQKGKEKEKKEKQCKKEKSKAAKNEKEKESHEERRQCMLDAWHSIVPVPGCFYAEGVRIDFVVYDFYMVGNQMRTLVLLEPGSQASCTVHDAFVFRAHLMHVWLNARDFVDPAPNMTQVEKDPKKYFPTHKWHYKQFYIRSKDGNAFHDMDEPMQETAKALKHGTPFATWTTRTEAFFKRVRRDIVPSTWKPIHAKLAEYLPQKAILTPLDAAHRCTAGDDCFACDGVRNALNNWQSDNITNTPLPFIDLLPWIPSTVQWQLDMFLKPASIALEQIFRTNPKNSLTSTGKAPSSSSSSLASVASSSSSLALTLASSSSSSLSAASSSLALTLASSLSAASSSAASSSAASSSSALLSAPRSRSASSSSSSSSSFSSTLVKIESASSASDAMENQQQHGTLIPSAKCLMVPGCHGAPVYYWSQCCTGQQASACETHVEERRKLNGFMLCPRHKKFGRFRHIDT